MALSDTSPAAREVYFRRLAEMTPSERLAAAVSLWEAGDSVQRAGIRLMYPDADEAEILFHLAVRRYGEEIARKVYGRR